MNNINDFVIKDGILEEYCGEGGAVVIPDGVTSIGGYAFEGCTSLTSITIPNGVTSIGDRAFSGCTSLTNITIPDSITSLGDLAFENCTSLHYNIYGAVKYLGNEGNPYLVAITTTNTDLAICEIHSQTKILADGAFSDCKSLISVTIPDGVTSIGDSAFYGCESLTNVTIPDSITSVGDCMFEGCKSLTTITIPDGVTNIGDWAFKKRTSLELWTPNPIEQDILDRLEETCGEVLKEAPSELLADKKFILKAVDKCGWALQYASDELRNDEEVALTAIQGWDGVSVNYSYAIEYASEELRSNRDFMRKAIEMTEGEAFSGATEELKNDKEMVLFAVKHCSPPSQVEPDIILRYASEEMRADKDVVLAAVRQNGWSLKYASDELKADKDIVLVATINSRWSLTYASPALRSDKEFVIELVEIVGKDALKYIDETLQNDADVLEAAKRHVPPTEDGNYWHYIDGEPTIW